MNKQPYYQRAVILFTMAGREIKKEELWDILMRGLVTIPGYVVRTLEIDELDAEPGDPTDLME